MIGTKAAKEKRKPISLLKVKRAIEKAIAKDATLNKYLKAGYRVRCESRAMADMSWAYCECGKRIPPTGWEVAKGTDDIGIYNHYIRFVIGETITGDNPRPTYSLQTLARWEQQEFPNCCAVTIFTHAWVHYALRNQGLGRLLHQFRLYLAESRGGYSIAVCTIVTGDEDDPADRGPYYNNEHEPQLKIVNKEGWTIDKHIWNPKSYNNVGLYSILLKPSG